MQFNWEKRDFQPGQRVGMLGMPGPPEPDFALALWSFWRAGLIARPINTRFPLSLMMSLLYDCEILLSPLYLQGQSGDSFTAPEWLNFRKFSEFAAHIYSGELPRSLVLPRPVFSPEQPLTEILTSGSSGQPKAVLHTWGNHLASARGSLAHIPLRPEDTWLAALPLFHIGGLAILIRTALAGARVAFPPKEMPLEQALAVFRPTHLSLVSTQLYRLLQVPESIPLLQNCKAILLGGSAIPTALIEKAFALELPIHCSYGSTEMASQICTTRPGASLAELMTSGPVLPEREVKISPEGEICVRGATRFVGYVSQSGLETPFDAEGWFATGDLGQFTPEGWLQVSGRRDHRFISGGENIQPEAIEAALLRLPDILQAVVVPVPDPEFGQRPVAFIEALRPVEPADIRTGLKAELPPFMLPKAIFDWPQNQEKGWKPSRQNLQILAEQRLPLI
ncbi:MAG: AMP-binding protein [Candidatus Sericytochromatia bacterium]